MMRPILILLLVALFTLATLAVLDSMAQLPSDLISYKEPAKLMSLQNVDPTSALKIDGGNAPLGKAERKPMADLGPYSSEGRTETQDVNATTFENFTLEIPEIPISVGNVSNITVNI